MSKDKTEYQSKHMKTFSAPISVKEAHLELEKIISPELFDVCKSFKANIDSLSSATILPMSLAYNTASKMNWFVRLKSALQQGDLKGSKTEQKIEVERRMEALDNNDDFEWTLSFLDDFMDDEEIGIKRGITNIFNLSIINIWTIFETLSCDMWIAIVNSRPKTLGKTAVEARKENIMKSITNMVIESHFELSIAHKIGDIASSEYDFSGVKGISKAFSIILQKDKTSINSILNNHILYEVQALRNVLVHNAGIIDNAFCRMTNDMSKLDQKVEITGEQLTTYGNEVIKLCIELIQTVDASIQKNYSNETRD